MTDIDTRQQPPPAEPAQRRFPRGFPIFAILALAIVALLVGGFGGSYQSKLTNVQKNENDTNMAIVRNIA